MLPISHVRAKCPNGATKFLDMVRSLVPGPPTRAMLRAERTSARITVDAIELVEKYRRPPGTTPLRTKS
jgi:hypothetical protein